MDTTLVLVLYAAVAALVTSYNFYQVVVLRPRPRYFSFTDDVILALTILFVGAVWVLFVPGLLIGGAVQVSRYIAAAWPAGWALPRHSELRVR